MMDDLAWPVLKQVSFSVSGNDSLSCYLDLSLLSVTSTQFSCPCSRGEWMAIFSELLFSGEKKQ
jgi:hypothetical protein